MINLVCLPSEEHISQPYRLSPPTQAEDLDAYLMFIFYGSHLGEGGATCNAASLKKKAKSEQIKQVCPRSLEINSCHLMKPKQATLPLLVIMRPHCLAFNIKACKRCATLINQDRVGGGVGGEKNEHGGR